nr:MAG TPA: hypothetical protein [Caudoviricetes sp.]DAW80674.1 MAG TPA: hypothetical protein [Caudoviricetes sp.]
MFPLMFYEIIVFRLCWRLLRTDPLSSTKHYNDEY